MIESHKVISNVYQRIKYNENKVKKKDASVLVSNIRYQNTKDAYHKFTAIKDTSNHNLTKWGFHSFINLPKSESLTDEKFTYVAETFLDKMGMANAPYIVYRHTDKPDQEHIHIVTSRHNFDGSKSSDSFTRLKANRIMSELEQELGLQNISQKAVDNENKRTREQNKRPEDILLPDTSQSGLEAFKRRKQRRVKKELAKTIYRTFKNTQDLHLVGEKLRRKGIKMMFNTNSSGISGIKFQIASNEYYELPYQNKPNYVQGTKLSEEHLTELEERGEVTIDDKKFFASENGLVLTETEKNARDHIESKVENETTFKGSSLDKALSWNSLKDIVSELSVEEQLSLAEGIHNENYSYQDLSTKDKKLLFAIENYNSTGVRESFLDGANLEKVNSNLGEEIINSKYYQETVVRISKEAKKANIDNQKFYDELREAINKGINAKGLLLYLNQMNFKIKESKGELEILNLNGLEKINLQEFKYTGKYKIEDHSKTLKKCDYYLNLRKSNIDDLINLDKSGKITQESLRKASKQLSLSEADKLLIRGLNSHNPRLAFTALKNGADQSIVKMYNKYFPNQIEEMITKNRKEYKQIQNLRSLSRSTKSLIYYFEMDIEDGMDRQQQ